ncbi:uncharacterized protein LOC125179482 [Hyalella azteca]|uniref:Uncharacterized protein LOC125179482 n=1 Tax=Hyalella azteca TaxID=294128 RepID=A0A979FVV1_HYAAZ|nr:uncharacterized protein LOC125179482 [Hyalella azteca]
MHDGSDFKAYGFFHDDISCDQENAAVATERQRACYRLSLPTSCTVIAASLLLATAVKSLVIAAAYHGGVLESECCVPQHRVLAGLLVGIMELLLFFSSGLWLCAAVIRHNVSALFVPPFVMLMLLAAVNVTLAVLMLVSGVWLDVFVRAVIAFVVDQQLLMEGLTERPPPAVLLGVSLHPDSPVRELTV